MVGMRRGPLKIGPKKIEGKMEFGAKKIEFRAKKIEFSAKKIVLVLVDEKKYPKKIVFYPRMSKKGVKTVAHPYRDRYREYPPPHPAGVGVGMGVEFRTVITMKGIYGTFPSITSDARTCLWQATSSAPLNQPISSRETGPGNMFLKVSHL